MSFHGLKHENNGLTDKIVHTCIMEIPKRSVFVSRFGPQDILFKRSGLGDNLNWFSSGPGILFLNASKTDLKYLVSANKVCIQIGLVWPTVMMYHILINALLILF